MRTEKTGVIVSVALPVAGLRVVDRDIDVFDV